MPEEIPYLTQRCNSWWTIHDTFEGHQNRQNRWGYLSGSVLANLSSRFRPTRRLYSSDDRRKFDNILKDLFNHKSCNSTLLSLSLKITRGNCVWLCDQGRPWSACTSVIFSSDHDLSSSIFSLLHLYFVLILILYALIHKTFTKIIMIQSPLGNSWFEFIRFRNSS